MKDQTCFKTANNPSNIDFFFPHSSLAFQNTKAAFTGLSNCHKLVLTLLKQPIHKTNQINWFTEIIKNLVFLTSMMT